MSSGHPTKHPSNFQDLTGRRFGRLTVLSLADTPGGNPWEPRWICRCDCGTIRTPRGRDLRRGNTTSCGCRRRDTFEGSAYAKTHGGWNSPEWSSWQAMLARCNNPDHIGYADYGGRGITVCDRWQGTDGFANFRADLGPRPKGMTLDRHPDPNGNYEPGNCRWATPTEQARNRRNNHLVTANGRTQTIAAWAVELGCSWETIHARLKMGWSPERAVTTEVRHYRKH